jgi:hypothetical protein
MPWEPWLHCGIWIGVLLALFMGEEGVLPPIDGMDWFWIIPGLVAPVMGFFSVWILHYHKGKPRYIAIWGRMLADFGLAFTIIAYQLDMVSHHGFEAIGWGHGILPNVILNFAAWFTLSLVWRDIKFIIATERLAAAIYYDLRHITLGEWADRVDDAS